MLVLEEGGVKFECRNISDDLKGTIGREILKNLGEFEEGEDDEQREVKNKQWIFLYCSKLKLQVNIHY